VGDRLVFAPYPGVELWSTDGTAAGTGRIFEGLASLGPWQGEALAVDYQGKLWATDGTASGTRFVVQLSDAPELVEYPVGPPIQAGPLVYLFRRVVDVDTAALELWRTDGTAEGTLRLTTIPFPYLKNPYPDPVVVGGRLFFSFFGVLWTSDGSVAGTQPAPIQLPVGTIALAAGKDVVYATSEGLGSNGEQGLWAIDPATLEPTLLASSRRIGGGSVGTPLGSLLGNALFFKMMNEQGVEHWWVTDGTPSSTHPLPDLLAGNTAARFVTAGDRRYFTACEPEHGCELWSTDRLGEDTRLVQDLWPGPRSSDPEILASTETSLLFAATESDAGRELWDLDLSK
jgi:ELWxxDGT repeat protein